MAARKVQLVDRSLDLIREVEIPDFYVPPDVVVDVDGVIYRHLINRNFDLVYVMASVARPEVGKESG